jgi:MFS family permease
MLSSLLTGGALIGLSLLNKWILIKCMGCFLGIGCGLFLPCSMALICQTIEKKHLGKAFGLFTIFQGLSFLSAPVLLDVFGKIFLWNELLLVLGVFSLFLGLIYSSFSSAFPNKTKEINPSFFQSVFSNPSFWVLLLLFTIITGLNVGIYNLAPHYFNFKGIDSSTIHLGLVIGRGLSLIFAFLGGWMSDRYGMSKIISIGLIISGLCIFLMGMVFQPNIAIVLWCIQSPIAVCITPIIQSAVAKIFPRESNASVVAIISSVSFSFGSGLIPQFITLFQSLNLYYLGFSIFGVVSLSIGVLMRSQRVYRHLTPTEEIL